MPDSEAAEVLIVEDEMIVGRELRGTLEGMGYNVIDVVRTGEEALQKISRQRPDLVLMDITLAGEKDGIEVAEEFDFEPGVGVVFLTAHADDATVERAKKVGSYGYLTKPINDTDLRNTVEVALYKQKMERKLRRKERELQQAEKLASLGRLAAGIMHEINNPNSYIQGNLDYVFKAWERLEEYFEERSVQDETIKSVLEELPETFEAMYDGTRRIEKIVNKVKGFARRGMPPAEYEPFNLREVVETTLDKAGETYDNVPEPEKLIGFEAAPGTEEVLVRGGPEEFEQVLNNLVENSLEAVEAEHSPEIKITLSREADRVCLSCRDNGKGIKPAARDKIFEPFQSLKEDSSGTGLGLTIVRNIVERMNGEIEVDSTPGEGTEFRIFLPVAEG